MTKNNGWLKRMVMMSVFVLLGIVGIMAFGQDDGANSKNEGRGESHEGGREGSESSGNTDGEEDGTAYALDETYDQVRGGARLVLAYDATGNTFSGTVENITNELLQNVRVEVHLSNGVELGPTPDLDLAPGEQVEVMLDANNIFDSWMAHAEVGTIEEQSEAVGEDCGENGDDNVEGRGESHEGRRESSEGNGNDAGEEDGTAYALDETFDQVRGGARLILAYDAASNVFSGTVENTSSEVLQKVRVEVHLSNGVELGPTSPTDLAPGEQAEVALDANNIFDRWTAHAEVGVDEEHDEAAGDGCEDRGESGEHGGREGRSEHVGRESRGEHGNNESDGD